MGWGGLGERRGGGGEGDVPGKKSAVLGGADAVAVAVAVARDLDPGKFESGGLGRPILLVESPCRRSIPGGSVRKPAVVVTGGQTIRDMTGRDTETLEAAEKGDTMAAASIASRRAQRYAAVGSESGRSARLSLLRTGGPKGTGNGSWDRIG